MNRSAALDSTSDSRRRSLQIGRSIPGLSLLTVAMILAGCKKSAAPETVGGQNLESPKISQVAVAYTNLVRMTEKTVFVNPELALLCRTVTPAEVEATRTLFGPHGNTSILVYMNQTAADALNHHVTPFPVGSVIVKQKVSLGYQRSDGISVGAGTTGVGGMVKRSPGYDPTHGDWEYFYVEGKEPLESGRLPTCVTCHSSARDRDHVFGTWKNRSLY